MKRIFLLSDYNNKIPQRENERVGLDTTIISRILKENNFEVTEMPIHSFAYHLSEIPIENSYFFYTSSQYPIYKNYIQDILLQIKLRGGWLIPEFRHFHAHENKSFQELEKERNNIPCPSSIVIATYEEGIEVLENSSYPLVLKKASGFGSRGVKIAKNKQEAKRILFQMLNKNFTFDYDSSVYLYRRLRSKGHYPKRFGKVIIQEYIQNLSYDWKILVLGEQCFYLKRYVKKNDFRASGSGIFSTTEDPSSKILDFAIHCKKQLQCPNVSLDIVEKDGVPLLIEYQTNHFGLLTAMLSAHYYEFENENWVKKEKTNDPEFYIANGICEYIK